MADRQTATPSPAAADNGSGTGNTPVVARPAAAAPRPSLAITPVGTQASFKNLLMGMEKQIAEILPRHVRAERIIKSALIAMNRQPDLLNCTTLSVMQAIMQASELGLDPSGGTLGQGYLIPFNNKVKLPGGREQWALQATFIPGYRGLCDLARRGGDVKLIEAHVVYKGDEFDYRLGSSRRLDHVPTDDGQEDADITHAYAIAWIDNDSYQFEVMTRKQLERTKASSKAGKFGPWVDHFAEMCRKTTIRRLVKYLPISSERLTTALEMGDRNEFGLSAGGSMIEAAASTPSAPVTRTKSGDAVADLLAADAAAQQNEPPAGDEATRLGDDAAEAVIAAKASEARRSAAKRGGAAASTLQVREGDNDEAGEAGEPADAPTPYQDDDAPEVGNAPQSSPPNVGDFDNFRELCMEAACFDAVDADPAVTPLTEADFSARFNAAALRGDVKAVNAKKSTPARLGLLKAFAEGRVGPDGKITE